MESLGCERAQGPGLRDAGAEHIAPAVHLPDLPGPGHLRVLGAGEPRGARFQQEIPERQVGTAAELHVSGWPGAGLADPGHHRGIQKWGHRPWQHYQHGTLGVRGLLLLLRVHHHHHREGRSEARTNGILTFYGANTVPPRALVFQSAGYGNLSPRTMAARLFCIFFALVGIPLNLVVLNRLGHCMQQAVHRCARRLGGAWKDPAKARWLAGSSALLSGLLLFLLLPPLLFNHMEGWTYVEGFYFSFVTLSTVGFGDYVIGMNPSRNYPLWYQNTVSLWILFGMAWLALIIKLILSLLEAPRESYSCYPQSSKGNFKPRSWSQGLDEEAGPHSPQPSCSPEGQHPEPSTQVSCCGKDS
nr:potassium channel subfamily K member 17 isoform X2 [Bubalus bubalis]